MFCLFLCVAPSPGFDVKNNWLISVKRRWDCSSLCRSIRPYRGGKCAFRACLRPGHKKLQGRNSFGIGRSIWEVIKRAVKLTANWKIHLLLLQIGNCWAAGPNRSHADSANHPRYHFPAYSSSSGQPEWTQVSPALYSSAATDLFALCCTLCRLTLLRKFFP